MKQKTQEQTFVVRDMRRAGHYRIDDEFIDSGIAASVGPLGIAVYNSICRHANRQSQSILSYARIAKETGMDRRSAIRTVKKLEQATLIQVLQRKGFANEFVITDKSEWAWSGDFRQYLTDTSDRESPVTESHQGGDTESPGGCHRVTGGVTHSHPKEKVFKEKVFKEKVERESGGGTESAAVSPEANSNMSTRAPAHAPAYSIWISFFPQDEARLSNAQRNIISSIKDVDLFREACIYWAAQGYSGLKVGKLLQVMDERKAETYHLCQTHADTTDIRSAARNNGNGHEGGDPRKIKARGKKTNANALDADVSPEEAARRIAASREREQQRQAQRGSVSDLDALTEQFQALPEEQQQQFKAVVEPRLKLYQNQMKPDVYTKTLLIAAAKEYQKTLAVG